MHVCRLGIGLKLIKHFNPKKDREWWRKKYSDPQLVRLILQGTLPKELWPHVNEIAGSLGQIMGYDDKNNKSGKTANDILKIIQEEAAVVAAGLANPGFVDFIGLLVEIRENRGNKDWKGPTSMHNQCK